MRLLAFAALLSAVGVARSSRIFFPEERPGQCVTADGRLGECVSASARRCALYPTIGHLLTSRPKVCRFIANDPVICCPKELVLPGTLGQVAAPEAELPAQAAPVPKLPTTETQPDSTPAPATTTSRPRPTARPSTQAPRPQATSTEPPPSRPAPPSSTIPPAPAGTTPPGQEQTQPPTETPTETPRVTTPAVEEETEPPTPATTASPTVVPTPPDDGLSGRLTECGLKQPQRAFLDNSTYSLSADAGGREVRLGRHPWAALVGLRAGEESLGWICGGALVSERLVVTAAHCVVLGGSPEKLAVRLGENDLRTLTDGDTVERRVAALRRHPEYLPPAQRHDLALLLLDTPVQMSDRVQPVCLPAQAADGAQELPTGGNVLELPAFDLSGDLTGSDPAGRGRLSGPAARVAPLSACAEPLEQLPHAGFIFPQGVRADTELCVLPAAGDTCLHDSGGPVVLEQEGAPATLLGLRLIGGCQQDQPELTVRLDHYVHFIRAAEQEMLEELKDQQDVDQS